MAQNRDRSEHQSRSPASARPKPATDGYAVDLRHHRDRAVVDGHHALPQQAHGRQRAPGEPVATGGGHHVGAGVESSIGAAEDDDPCIRGPDHAERVSNGKPHVHQQALRVPG